MSNDTKNQISIDSLRKQLRNAASQPPHEDPFSRAGSVAWSEWAQGCREIEGALRDAGEVF
jgi:hypothetical protein